MELNKAAQSARKAFSFTEYWEEEILEAHSFGNGRFIRGIAGADLEVCFRLYKTQDSLDIQIHHDDLLQWLRAIPSLCGHLDNGRYHTSVTMRLLLPYYPEISVKFAQDKREGHSFDALELFVRHFLLEGSVFATFGLEHLYEEQILTELHFHDIQHQYRSMSDDLDLLDEAIDELDQRDVKGSTRMDQPSQIKLSLAIARSDPVAVDKVLALEPGFVDADTLCRAIRYYEPTVFHLLLKHGAQVNGDDVIYVPLYQAAKRGHMDAVRLLLSYGANKEGGNFSHRATPLTGAASGGHLEIIQYLVEKEDVNIDGNRYKSPLSRAIKHRHAHIVDYLLRAGANILRKDTLVALSEVVGTSQTVCGDIFERYIAGMDNDARHLLFSRAVREGHLEIVRYLLEFGADVNPETRHRDVSDGDNSDTNTRRYNRQNYSPLALAALWRRSEVAHYLSLVGATLLNGEANISLPSLPSRSTRILFDPIAVGNKHQGNTVGEFLESIKHLKDLDGYVRTIRPEDRFHHSMARVTDVEDCPAVAAIQAQERRTMARRLLAKVAKSREKLLDAGTKQNPSDTFIRFVGQVGTSSSVWRSGTRAIQDICEGYMPRSLTNIVSALQVANAMRSAVPPSKLVCSKKEFLNDIPRWASLLSSTDQGLFFEIASYLWGIPVLITSQEGAGSFACVQALESFQELVSNLVRTSGLFAFGSRNSCGFYRLQTLRQQSSLVMRCSYGYKGRLPLVEWHPLPTPEVQENLHTNAPKPPDPEGVQLSILTRITVLMAGAIFGAILLYLCLSRYHLSTARLPLLTLYTGLGYASDQIVTRNYIILAMYIKPPSLVDSGSWRITDHWLAKPSSHSPVLPDRSPAERVQPHMAAVQSSYEGDYTMVDSTSTIDTILERESVDFSPSLSLLPMASPSTTTVSPYTATTATQSSTATGASVDGTISCKHCESKFKLGKNGRKGQASNLQKHMKYYHPETIPNYHQIMYHCQYSCGRIDPNKSNIKVHMKKYCAKRKGKQPTCHGKWREASQQKVRD